MLKDWNEFLSEKMTVNYPQAVISTKLTELSVLYMATVKGGKPL